MRLNNWGNINENININISTEENSFRRLMLSAKMLIKYITEKERERKRKSYDQIKPFIEIECCN